MSVKRLPEVLQEQGQKKWAHFERVVDAEDRQWLEHYRRENPVFGAELDLLWACSEFVAASCSSRPELLQNLVESGALDCSYDEQKMLADLQQAMSTIASEDQLMQVLRQFRQQQMVRIVWRDFTRKAPMTETTADMTYLAEAVLESTLDFLYRQACQKWGTPVGKSGEQQHLVVLGMGKLGAYELNVSSDIDLIFAYPEVGETRREPGDGGKTLSNQEFFIRLGQQLIKALDMRNADGFVFRVDMRLRPYGQSGALVLNFDAMEEYYQTQGRDWERYAMIKARVVAGDREAGRQLISLLRPFTYRKYIDFTAIEALRDMKALINREVQRKGMSENIKRGAGGIREVEFIAQAFQIIRGGRDARFQQPSLLAILELLDQEQLLPEGKADLLAVAYVFLRNVEHVVQGWQDQQTQMLPADELGQQRLAFLMGCSNWSEFVGQLDQHRQHIREVFDDVIAEQTGEPQGEQHPEGFQQGADVWREVCVGEQDAAVAALSALGYQQPEAAVDQLMKLQQHRAVATMPADARSRLDSLMPRLISECGAAGNGAESLTRILPMIEAVIRRSAYLLLLVENPRALQSLVMLCSASSWVASQLAQYPALLDELLDPRTLYSLPRRADLEDELRQQILRIPEDDLESLMDALRYFRRSHSLRVAACEIEGSLPLMKVSDYLTWLAEAILAHVYRLSWEQMVERYGEPLGVDAEAAEFLVVGYGKLGGIELGHGSDLDMVFIYDAKPNSYTDGERSVDVATFFTRLGQRMIHILTAQTASGALYEADMRLRPSGNSGMLVTTLNAFEKYQQQDAWVWEHQALVRARPIAGTTRLASGFEQVRQRVLSQQRDESELKAEVFNMREKMREHLGSKPTADEQQMFHLKQDRGGIVDIEFIVQYHVLRYGAQYPALLEYTDNVRILEAIEECELLSSAVVSCLNDAYIAYRSMGHRLNLEGESNTIAIEKAEEYRHQVADIWASIFGRDD